MAASNSHIAAFFMTSRHVLYRKPQSKKGSDKSSEVKSECFSWVRGKKKTSAMCWVNVLNYGFTVPAPPSLLHFPFCIYITPFQKVHTHTHTLTYTYFFIPATYLRPHRWHWQWVWRSLRQHPHPHQLHRMPVQMLACYRLHHW